MDNIFKAYCRALRRELQDAFNGLIQQDNAKAGHILAVLIDDLTEVIDDDPENRYIRSE